MIRAMIEARITLGLIVSAFIKARINTTITAALSNPVYGMFMPFLMVNDLRGQRKVLLF